MSQRVTYVGSPEHKNVVSFAGQPRLRADASICDKKLAHDLDRVQGWCKRLFRSVASANHGKVTFPGISGSGRRKRFMKAGLSTKSRGNTKAIPAEVIRSRIAGRETSREDIDEIAYLMGTSSYVIAHQVKNHRLAVIMDEP